MVCKNGKNGREVLQGASGLFFTASILFLLYVTNCGINYRSFPFYNQETWLLKIGI